MFKFNFSDRVSRASRGLALATAVTVSAGVAPAAMAGAVDVSAVTTEIAAQKAPMTDVGVTVLGVLMVPFAFKLVRKMF